MERAHADSAPSSAAFSSGDQPYWERHKWALLLSLVIAAFAIRAVVWMSFTGSIYGTQLMPDEQVYDVYARAYQEGRSLPGILGFNAHVPGFVFSIAYSLLGTDPSSTRLLNVVLGSATCLALYFIGAQLKDRKTGLLSALLGATYGPFILASVTAEKTALGLFLMGLSVAFGLRVVSRRTHVDIGIFGAAIALSTHVRGNALALALAAPILYVVLWRRCEPRASLVLKLFTYAVGLAMVLMPLSSGGILGATEHGFNLYLGNNLDNPTPYYRPARFAPSQPSLQGGGFVLKASLDSGMTLSASEAREYYRSELIRAWRASPTAAARKLMAKFVGSINVYEHAHNHNLAFVSRFIRPLALPWIGFGLLFPLALLGGIGCRKTPEGQWLLAMAAAYWTTLVVFFTDVRLRAPMALLLVPFAAAAIIDIVRRRGRSLAAASIVLILGSLASRLPTTGAGDLTTAYNLHALMLFDTGDYDGAEQYYRMSSQQIGLDSESAFLGLAAVATMQGDLARAERLLEKVPDEHYKAAEKYVHLGNIMVRRQRLREAADRLEHALEINPGLLPVYPILEAYRATLGEYRVARDVRGRYEYALTFFD